MGICGYLWVFVVFVICRHATREHVMSYGVSVLHDVPCHRKTCHARLVSKFCMQEVMQLKMAPQLAYSTASLVSHED